MSRDAENGLRFKMYCRDNTATSTQLIILTSELLNKLHSPHDSAFVARCLSEPAFSLRFISCCCFTHLFTLAKDHS